MQFKIVLRHCPKTRQRSYNPVCAVALSSISRGLYEKGSKRTLMTEHVPMEIAVRRQDGIDFLAVRGRLTIGEPSEPLNEALQSIVKNGGRKVVINLNGVPQIDSSGISSLVRISIQLAKEGGAVHLVCGAGRVRDALTVTRLVEAIPTYESDSAATASFA